jgi:hypothetical protein
LVFSNCSEVTNIYIRQSWSCSLLSSYYLHFWCQFQPANVKIFPNFLSINAQWYKPALFLFLFLFSLYKSQTNIEYLSLLLCWAGYIVDWKELLQYIKYSWIHSLHRSPLSSPFVHLYICIHLYTIFALYSPSHTLCPPRPLPLIPTLTGRTCSTLLFANFMKDKNGGNGGGVCLQVLHIQ